MSRCDKGAGVFATVSVIMLRILSLGLVYLGLVGVAFGEGEQAVTITDRMRFSGEVKRVFVVASGSRRVLQTQGASWIEHSEQGDVTCIGRVVVPNDETVIGVLSVVLGQKGEVRSSYQSLAVAELSPVRFLSSNQLRDLFVERRGVLRQLRGEVDSQDARLRGLQQDADAIANVSKIVSAEDELGEVQLKLKKLNEAFEGVEQRALQLKTRQPPMNAQNRESELVRALGELSIALVATENNALKRITSASGELKRKLQMIEDTKEEHVTLLEEELAEVRRQGR